MFGPTVYLWVQRQYSGGVNVRAVQYKTPPHDVAVSHFKKNLQLPRASPWKCCWWKYKNMSLSSHYSSGWTVSLHFFSSFPFSLPSITQASIGISDGGSRRPPPAFSTLLCLSVCVCVSRQEEGGTETRWAGERHPVAGCGAGPGWVGGGRGGSWGGLYCNMMFILVMYLTVEDNRGLSVW